MESNNDIVDQVDLSQVACHVSVDFLVTQILDRAEDEDRFASAFVGSWKRNLGGIVFFQHLQWQLFSNQQRKCRSTDGVLLLQPLKTLLTSCYGNAMCFSFNLAELNLRNLVTI